MIQVKDSSRISISAHYTGYVWSLHGLQDRAFATADGRVAHWVLRLPNFVLGQKIVGADIDTFLLHRHIVIDYLVRTAIASGHTQVVEIAAGLSGRGYHFCREYDHLTYIETDLPEMVQKKQTLLRGLPGYEAKRHHVAVCDILEKNTPKSLEALFADRLDLSQKTLVVTEGLVNYFPLNVVSDFWQRLATLLRGVPSGMYVTEIYPELENHPFYGFMKLAQKAVGFFTKGDWPLHFKSDGEMKSAFEDLGYRRVSVHDPADFYGRLPIPKVKVPTMVRIVCAEV